MILFGKTIFPTFSSKTLLDEAQRESTNKDRLINRLSRSLKDRDDSIGELLEASELSGSGSATPTKQLEIINKLKDRLKERDKAVEVKIVMNHEAEAEMFCCWTDG